MLVHPWLQQTPMTPASPTRQPLTPRSFGPQADSAVHPFAPSQ
jgi:hypothetical protein